MVNLMKGHGGRSDAGYEDELRASVDRPNCGPSRLEILVSSAGLTKFRLVMCGLLLGAKAKVITYRTRIYATCQAASTA